MADGDFDTFSIILVGLLLHGMDLSAVAYMTQTHFPIISQPSTYIFVLSVLLALCSMRLHLRMPNHPHWRLCFHTIQALLFYLLADYLLYTMWRPISSYINYRCNQQRRRSKNPDMGDNWAQRSCLTFSGLTVSLVVLALSLLLVYRTPARPCRLCQRRQANYDEPEIEMFIHGRPCCRHERKLLMQMFQSHTEC